MTENDDVPSIDELFNAEPVGPSPILTVSQMRALQRQQANVLTSVATGGARIQDVNSDYITNALVLRDSFVRIGLPNPFQWSDLWEWYGQWSRETSQYWERRQIIGNLTKTALKGLASFEVVGEVQDVGSTGEATWEAVDVRIAALIKERLKKPLDTLTASFAPTSPTEFPGSHVTRSRPGAGGSSHDSPDSSNTILSW